MKMEISFFSTLSQPAHYYAVVQSQSPLPSGMSTGKILDWSIANPAPSDPSVPLLDLLAFGRFIANDLTSSRCFLHWASHVRWTPKFCAKLYRSGYRPARNRQVQTRHNLLSLRLFLHAKCMLAGIVCQHQHQQTGGVIANVLVVLRQLKKTDNCAHLSSSFSSPYFFSHLFF